MIDLDHPNYLNHPAADQRAAFEYRPGDDSTAAPAVTIVTPFYNTGPVFAETMRSVFRQSFQQWEWLIVNDASTNPEALAMLDRVRQSDPRVRVIDHQVNQGPSAARNTGYRAARTDYVVQ